MIGKTVAHFKITAKLGEGGMGEVYLAEDTKLGRGVAIKTLPPAVAADPERLGRFQREAKVLASLNHAHIAGIHQVEEADGAVFLVMELVEGEDLKERIARGALPLEEALGYALQIAEALETAHDRGIVHRDLKPANIKVTPDGRIKVLDFGLAKALEGDPTASGASPSISLSPTLTAQATSAGVLIGTAAYMSPEQARGQAVDRRADVWAFGLVLFEMLTGKMVYSGDTVSDTLAGVLAREPQWADLTTSTPPAIRRLLERCLNKNLRRRLQAIGEARIILEDYLENPTPVEQAAPAAPIARPSGRKRLLPWAVSAVLVAALGFSLVARLGADGERPVLHASIELPEGKRLHRGFGSPVVLSPAGDRIATTIDSGTEHELLIRALDQWEGSTLMVASGQDRPYHPFFSPDGSWLGFATPTSLKKVPVTGGTPIKLCDVNLSRGATWAPDDTIVFAPNPSSGLHRVSAAGGEPEAVTELATGEVTHRWPHFLPGGRVLLFTVHSSESDFDEARIEALDLASGERSAVIRGGSDARYLDSGHLVYVNQGTLFAVPFDPSSLEIKGAAAPVVQQVGSSVQGGGYYDVANDGLLAFAPAIEGALTQLRALWVDRAGAFEPLTDEERDYRNPRFSPDGRRLAVEIVTEGNVDVWVLDLERDVPTRLTFHDQFDGNPVWSPDGESIAFSSARGEGVRAIYRKAADGSGEAELIAESDQPIDPWTWSPDGKHIGVMTQSPKTVIDVGLLSVADGTLVPFVATPYVDYGPVFSPDGRWIAYGSNESGDWEVYVRPADGSRGKWQVSSGGGTYPRWSADGKEIFVALDGGTVQSVEVAPEGAGLRFGRPRELFSGPFAVLTGDDMMYDVAPDGRRFVLFQGEIDSSTQVHEHVRLVSEWFNELERTFDRSR